MNSLIRDPARRGFCSSFPSPRDSLSEHDARKRKAPSGKVGRESAGNRCFDVRAPPEARLRLDHKHV
jgi:hypothetical protein